MIALALKAATLLRPVIDWLEHKAGGKEAVDEAIAKGSRKLGIGKTLALVIALAPATAPWLELVGLDGASDTARAAADILSGDEGGWDYSHLATAVLLAVFGLRARR